MSFQPQLSKGSKKILKQKEQNESKVHERLFSAKGGQSAQKTMVKSKDGGEEKEEKKDFCPQINKKSQKIKREAKIEELLVNDAKRR